MDTGLLIAIVALVTAAAAVGRAIALQREIRALRRDIDRTDVSEH